MGGRQPPRRSPQRRHNEADRVPLIPSWLRVLTVLVVLTPWSVGVMFSILVLKQLPDVAWMAVPSSVIVAVAPSWSLPRRRGAGPDEPDPQEEPEPEPEPEPERRRPARRETAWDDEPDEWSGWRRQ